MEHLFVLRWLHIVGATVLLGTGAGIAFFMVMSHRSNDAAIVAHTAGVVVVADYVFTASAVVLQPITGVLLAREMGWPLLQGWVGVSIGLYLAIGLCWLPVVRMQMRMRDLAREAALRSEALPAAYHALFKRWFRLGIPAFTLVLVTIWLMVRKPAIGLLG